MSSSDSTTIAGFIDLNYGADLHSPGVCQPRNRAFDRNGSIDVHLSPKHAGGISLRDPLSLIWRAAKGFDSAPADLSESGPRMALRNGQPEVEKSFPS